MTTVERTKNQKRMLIAAILALILSILMILMGILFLFFFGLTLSETLVEQMAEDGIATSDVMLVQGVFGKIARYFLFVGI